MSQICDIQGMETRPVNIHLYQTIDGVEPFTKWFSALKNLEAVARITSRLDLLEMGNWRDYKEQK